MNLVPHSVDNQTVAATPRHHEVGDARRKICSGLGGQFHRMLIGVFRERTVGIVGGHGISVV